MFVLYFLAAVVQLAGVLANFSQNRFGRR